MIRSRRVGATHHDLSHMSSSRVHHNFWSQLQCVLLVICMLGGLVVQPISAADLNELEEQAMRNAVVRVAPSVVRIQTVGGVDRVGEVQLGRGPSTGLVVSAEGHIISSAFNFARKPTAIFVHAADGTRLAAKLVATDHSRSLVLLKVDLPEDGGKLEVPAEVPLSEIRVGAWAIAAGRTLGEDEPNISVGIISATGRIWSKAVQTDAKVSPANYGGPLLDIRGRVIGVLVPLSPQATHELAGAEWYDSGIGFAVPLEDIKKVLPRLIAGEDLYRGLLGISLKGKDQFGALPVIAATQPKSPAHEAGLKTGDRILKANGIPVVNQAQFMHIVGPLYAGEKVKLVVLRDKKEIEAEVELTDKLEPYAHPFLGILLRRDEGEKPGVVVRHVFAESPAEAAGIEPGDRITQVGDKKVKSRDEIYGVLAGYGPENEVRIKWTRDEEDKGFVATLAKLPETIAEELPPARTARDMPKDLERPQVGRFEVKLPEFKNKCVAYVPENYDPEASYGVVVWLHAPGRFNEKRLLERWKEHCDKSDLILLAPQASDRTKWSSGEVEFVVRALIEIRKSYSVDNTRVVAHGYQGGGAMAFLVGSSRMSQVHGIAAVDAAIPRTIKPQPLNPLARAAIYMAYEDKGPTTSRIKNLIQELRKLNYPVTERALGAETRYLNSGEISELVRWIDALDRI